VVKTPSFLKGIWDLTKAYAKNLFTTRHFGGILQFHIDEILPKANASLALKDLWENSIWSPVRDILSRPSKQIRGSLTQIGFSLAKEGLHASEEEMKALEACSRLVELLHAGSLVVDDIQDDSELRRGGPTLHKMVGLPLALNAGNWIYFYAFESVKKLNLPATLRSQIYEEVHETLLAAHYGQALDISARIDEMNPTELQEIVQTSLELKSGALMALPLTLGAYIAGADAATILTIKQFGIQFGASLQMFDDLGNLTVENQTSKHLEDLALKRPSYIWLYLAEGENQSHLDWLRECVEKFPDYRPLREFFSITDIKTKAHNQAFRVMNTHLNNLARDLSNESSPIFEELRTLGKRIADAY
jgi:geranylgeranyl pyrophosphate synthase